MEQKLGLGFFVVLICLCMGAKSETNTTVVLSNTTLELTTANMLEEETTTTAEMPTTITENEETTAIASGTLPLAASSTSVIATDSGLNITDGMNITESNTIPQSSTAMNEVALNVTSIIKLFTSSNQTQSVLMAYNTTNEELFNSLVNFTIEQTAEVINGFLNTSTGQLLVELITTNSSLILENYHTEIDTSKRQVYLYAIILDLEENINNSEFVKRFLDHIVFKEENSTYILDEKRLLPRACKEYERAGGRSTGCQPTSTTTPIVELDYQLIIGCAVGGGLALILVMSIVVVYIKKRSGSKVSPSQNGVGRGNGQLSRTHSDISVTSHSNVDT